jgi:hypothetical protein
MISKILRLLTLLGIILVSLSVYGQIDPVEKEILDFDESKSSINIPQFENKYTGAAGKMHYITIGFGGFSRGLERKY